MRIRDIGALAILLVGTTFVGAQTAAKQPAPAFVDVQLVDPEGGALENATVVLIDSDKSSVQTIRSDAHGKASLRMAGEYQDLAVSCPGFVPQARNLRVKPGTRDTEHFVLQICQHCPGVNADRFDYDNDPTKQQSFTLDRAGGNQIAVTRKEFAAMPHISVDVVNGHSGAHEHYSGVKLSEVLRLVKTPLGDALHDEALQGSINVGGADWYTVTLSLAEVDASFHTGEVIVADSVDGHSLGKDGPWKLVVTEDKRPARWVRNVWNISYSPNVAPEYSSQR
jgi:hypothetical protein